MGNAWNMVKRAKDERRFQTYKDGIEDYWSIHHELNEGQRLVMNSAIFAVNHRLFSRFDPK